MWKHLKKDEKEKKDKNNPCLLFSSRRSREGTARTLSDPVTETWPCSVKRKVIIPLPTPASVTIHESGKMK